MGQAYILYVYNDAIKDASVLDIGKAVLTVCQDHWSRTANSAPIKSAANAVNLAAEQHSSWEQVFLWSQNCLRSAADLSVEELELARHKIDEASQDRRGSEKKG
jgi:hypothetical protein